MGTKKNVLVGGATMSTSDDGNAWTEAGYTDDGVTLDYEPAFSDVNVDEELLPVKKIKTGEKLLVSANLAEGTLENYMLAVGLPTTALVTDAEAKTKTLNLISNPNIVEKQIKLVGKSPDGLDRTITFAKIVSVGKVSSKYTNKGGKTLIPVQFEVLAGDAGYGSIVDKTA